MEMLEHYDTCCPYCGEQIATLVDCSAGSHNYIEDCTVCCRPIEFSAEIGDGQLLGLTARRDDE